MHASWAFRRFFFLLPRRRSGAGARRRAVALVLAGLLLAGTVSVGTATSPAAAAPGDPPPPLSLRTLGSSQTIAFPGQQGEVSLSLPVPPGLTPTEIRGVAQYPAFVTGGTVDVLHRGRLISRTQIDPAVNSPLVLPLRGVRVQDNTADLVLRAYLRTAGSCLFDADTGFRIQNASAVYGGRESVPATVADFLPPILRKLTIFVPEDVATAEGAAAVELATAVVAEYGSATVEVETAALPRSADAPPQPVDPLERQVMINTNMPRGLSLGAGAGWPVLRIGGSAEELATQVRFLTSDLSSIAVSSAAVAGAPFAAPQLAPEVTTLSAVGVTDQLVSSTGWPSISFGIDQARLGRPSKAVRVQLSGTYTPMGGQIAATVGDRVIASWPADASGRYDAWVEVPQDLLGRYTEVTVTYNHGEVTEECGTGVRSSLSLDASGEVRSQRADPPTPSGFSSLPQALMPRTSLAWTDGGVDDVARAVALMTGLQRLSAVRVGIDVVPLAEAIASSGPAVVIAADGRDLPEVALPVGAEGGTLSVLDAQGRRSEVTLSPAVRFGSVQVARDGGRSVVVASSTGDAEDLDAVLAWLGADPDRWPSLGGDAVLQVSGQEPVVVVVDEEQAGQEESTTAFPWTRLAIVAAVIVLVAAAIASVVTRRRSRRRGNPGRRSTDHPGSAGGRPGTPEA